MGIQGTAVFDPVAIVPLADRASRGLVIEVVFWFERLWRMLTLKYAQACIGGVKKIAETFRSRIERDLVLHTVYQERGENGKAHDLLYETAYDLTWLRSNHIDELRVHLEAQDDMRLNVRLLEVVKRAALITEIPPLRRALQTLVTDFEGKVSAHFDYDEAQDSDEEFLQIQEEPAPIVVLPPPAAAPRTRKDILIGVVYVVADNEEFVEEEAVCQNSLPELEGNAIEAALALHTPNQRVANDSKMVPTLACERLLKRDFVQHLVTAKPDYSAVKFLANLLDQISAEEAMYFITGLPLMSLLYLYELSNTHNELLLNQIANDYHTMEAGGNKRQNIFRAYLELHCGDELVGGRYSSLLARMKDLAWPQFTDVM